MTKFKKDDLVRVHATRFNAPDGKKDKNGRTFAEDWEKKGHGEWCHGRVTFVYKKKSRQPQKYRILYDEGTVMESLEEHMEAFWPAPSGLPHKSIIKRIPQSKNIELKIVTLSTALP